MERVSTDQDKRQSAYLVHVGRRLRRDPLPVATLLLDAHQRACSFAGELWFHAIRKHRPTQQPAEAAAARRREQKPGLNAEATVNHLGANRLACKGVERTTGIESHERPDAPTAFTSYVEDVVAEGHE